MSQTVAIFVDAYRSVNSQKLFWLAMVISGLVVASFACVGVNPQGVKLLFWQFNGLGLNSKIIPPAMFYKLIFVNAGIGLWLSWLAAILALVSTAGIFPRLIGCGMIDLFVSKPISRLRLFVTEYATGLLFVTIQVTIFCVASLLLIGLRGGVWEPGLLVAVPLVVCFFSYLFAVCVLLGVLTRSTIAALIFTLLFWSVVFMVRKAEHTVLMFQSMEQHGVNFADLQAETNRPARRPMAGGDKTAQSPRKNAPATAREPATGGGLETAYRILRGINTVLPKTGETIDLLERLLIRLADLPPATPDNSPQRAMQAAARDVEQALYRRSPFWIGFELLVLTYAAWVFCRRDY